MLMHDLESLLKQTVLIQMLTDCKSLFDVIVKTCRTVQRRLMTDITSCRQAHESQEIPDIGCVNSKSNLALRQVS